MMNYELQSAEQGSPTLPQSGRRSETAANLSYYVRAARFSPPTLWGDKRGEFFARTRRSETATSFSTDGTSSRERTAVRHYRRRKTQQPVSLPSLGFLVFFRTLAVSA